jgi:hypothetical protein
MKLLLTLTILTRVVESALVKAAVNSVHIAKLNNRFMPKKNARRRKLIILFSGDRPNNAASPADHDEVRVVVVSFANTPLIAAQAPDETARMIQMG